MMWKVKDRLGRDKLFYDIADGKYEDALSEIQMMCICHDIRKMRGSFKWIMK